VVIVVVKKDLLVNTLVKQNIMAKIDTHIGDPY